MMTGAWTSGTLSHLHSNNSQCQCCVVLNRFPDNFDVFRGRLTEPNSECKSENFAPIDIPVSVSVSLNVEHFSQGVPDPSNLFGRSSRAVRRASNLTIPEETRLLQILPLASTMQALGGVSVCQCRVILQSDIASTATHTHSADISRLTRPGCINTHMRRSALS
jgi:hypothetical protein